LRVRRAGKPSGEFRWIWAWPVNLAALAYGILAIINMVWPRTPQDPWYRNYGMIVGTVAVVGTVFSTPSCFGLTIASMRRSDAHLAHLGREAS